MFISFEGIDGSGKSTQIALLAERLREAGYAVDVFREPGGTALAEKIRSLLLDPAYDIEAFSELLLFSAARAQLVARKIVPALEAGRVVICDRFFDSTTAYQGAGRQVEDMQWLRAFHLKVTGGLVPDRTFLLTLSAEDALARRAVRDAGGAGDRMERVDTAFYERVAAAYLQLASEESRFCVLDARNTVEDLHRLIWADLENMWGNQTGTRAIGLGSSITD